MCICIFNTSWVVKRWWGWELLLTYWQDCFSLVLLVFKHNGNNLSALHNCFGQIGVWRGVSTKQEKFSVPALWLVPGPAMQTWLYMLPAYLGGQLITKPSWCGDTIFSSNGFSCCTCNTCSSLAVLLEWACTPAYQPVILLLSVTLYWSLLSVSPSQSCISKILPYGQQWDGNPWTLDLLSALKTCIFLSASFFWKYCVYFYLLLNVSKEQSTPVKLLLLYDIHSIFL